jgi:hypothetical protein
MLSGFRILANEPLHLGDLADPAPINSVGKSRGNAGLYSADSAIVPEYPVSDVE